MDTDKKDIFHSLLVSPMLRAPVSTAGLAIIVSYLCQRLSLPMQKIARMVLISLKWS